MGEAEAVEVEAVELVAFVGGVAQGVVEVLREVVDAAAVALGAEEGHRLDFVTLIVLFSYVVILPATVLI